MRFIEYLQEQALLLEARIDFLKQKYKGVGTAHDPDAEHQDSDAIVDHFATHADPSPTKKHTQWIMDQYKKGAIKQEDAPSIKTTLSHFDTHHAKLENKQLNQYQSIDHLAAALAPHIGDFASNRERKKAIKDDGSEVILNHNGVTVRHLKTKEAAILYGKNTEWCTAYTEARNRFDEYKASGELYTIHHNNRKYQYHTAHDEFQDENNFPVELSTLPHDVLAGIGKSTHPHMAQFNAHFKNPHATPQSIEVAYNSQKPSVRYDAISHMSAPDHIVDDAVYSLESLDREAAATRGALLSPEQVHHLVKTMKPRVHSRLAHSGAHLTDEHISYMIPQASLTTMKHLVNYPNFGEHHLEAALNINDTSARRTAAGSPKMTPRLIDKAMGDEDAAVGAIALSSPNATHEQLTRILQVPTDNPLAAIEAVKHPKATPQHIEMALFGDNGLSLQNKGKLQRYALKSPALTHEHMDKIMDGDDNELKDKALLLAHHRVLDRHLFKALDTDDIDVQLSAIESPAATHEFHSKVIDSGNPNWLYSAFKHIKNPTSDQIHKGLDNPEYHIRRMAVTHPNATEEHLLRAVDENEHPEVRNTAAFHPNATDKVVKKYYKDDL